MLQVINRGARARAIYCHPFGLCRHPTRGWRSRKSQPAYRQAFLPPVTASLMLDLRPLPGKPPSLPCTVDSFWTAPGVFFTLEVRLNGFFLPSFSPFPTGAMEIERCSANEGSVFVRACKLGLRPSVLDCRVLDDVWFVCEDMRPFSTGKFMPCEVLGRRLSLEMVFT